MALVFSLSSALLAILIQKWVRDYMHVFQRYSDPLKSARLRQYLHEGCEKWYMPVVAEAVPGLLHVSLFLFLVGLGDFILNINTTVGLCTIVPIGFSGLLYIFTMFASVLYPQSPYQNSFSALIWHLIQRLRGWTCKDQRVESASKPVSPNMSERQMQLAMAESGERKKRDGRAIRWLVDSLTEEAEMELFVFAIPGSFNAEWGLRVWKGISEVDEDEYSTLNQKQKGIAAAPSTETNISTSMSLTIQTPPRATTIGNLSGFILRLIGMCTTNVSSTDIVAPARCTFNSPAPSVITSPQEENVVRELSRRVAQLLETCKNRGLFTTDEQWRKRTRACVETTASLVGCANAELVWFGDVGRLLGDIGGVEKTGESFSTGMDRSFVIRWICLSTMAIRPVLGGDRLLQQMADNIVNSIESFGEQGAPDEQPLKGAEGINDKFIRAWGCLLRLFWALFQGPNLTEQDMVEILRNHEFLITELERISVSASRLTWVDQGCTFLLRHMDQITHGITGQLPSVQKRFPTTGPIPFSQVLEFFEDPLKFPIIPPGQVLQSLCSLAPRFRNILEGQEDAGETRETLMSLRAIDRVINLATSPLQRQMWRLQDLLEGGGLGFIVELFFRALKQLLSTSLSQELQSALFIGTFRVITSDWSLYKHSLGTQKILLDAVASEYGIFSDFNYPAYITDEFLQLLGNMLDKQTGPHIDLALQQLENPPPWNYRGSPEFRANASNVIFQSSQI